MLMISTLFRDDALLPMAFVDILTRMGAVVDAIAAANPIYARKNWFFKGYTKEETRLYRVFEHEKPTTAAIAVLNEEFRKSKDRTFVTMWAGDENAPSMVGMECHIGPPGKKRSFLVEVSGDPGILRPDAMTALVSCIAKEFRPACIEVAPVEYADKQVFDDKPGAGWMLYLPTKLSTQQVPEARALIPVPEKGGKQTGTIIVSVTDSAFSVDNLQHIGIANRTEIRLVDQDLLPRYVDM